MEKILCLLLPLIISVACTNNPKKVKSNLVLATNLDFNGEYKFANKEYGLSRRNWNAEYWHLQIHDYQGKLSFIDAARGLYSFDLATYTKVEENTISIFLDSVIPIRTISWETFVEKKLDTLKHGTLLMKIQQENSKLKVTYETISQLQCKELDMGFPFIQKIK